MENDALTHAKVITGQANVYRVHVTNDHFPPVGLVRGVTDRDFASFDAARAAVLGAFCQRRKRLSVADPRFDANPALCAAWRVQHGVVTIEAAYSEEHDSRGRYEGR